MGKLDGKKIAFLATDGVKQSELTQPSPDDLPAFCANLVEELCEGEHEQLAEAVAADA